MQLASSPVTFPSIMGRYLKLFETPRPRGYVIAWTSFSGNSGAWWGVNLSEHHRAIGSVVHVLHRTRN